MRARVAAAALAVALAAASATAAPAGPGASDWRPVDPQNTLVIDTSRGRIIVELYPEVAPAAVAQIETLARQHFYDGLTFFRVIDGFMDQTGDPLNTGKGQSSLSNLKAEFDFRYTPGAGSGVNELVAITGGEIGFVGALPVIGQPDAMAGLTVDGKVRGFGLFCSGVVGMARAQDPDTGNSQFFLMRGVQHSLDQKYTPVGRVISGLAAVRAVKTGDPVADPKDRMVSVQVLADMPAGVRPAPRLLDTGSAYFRAEAASLRAAKGGAFDPCELDVPAPEAPGGARLTRRAGHAPFRAFRNRPLELAEPPLMHAYRTHTCGELRLGDAGQPARLSGWIHRKRDHGGLLFIDLRDHYGLTQLVFSPGTPDFTLAERLRAESVITIDGQVVARTDDTINPNLPTGEIEVRVETLEVLSEAAELPVPVFGEPDYPEELRLKYRYLDLRRETLHRNIVLRSKVVDSIRRRMVEQGFLEFTTPILTASSPEGARDFLVPSRLHPGKFYALPQAPQQFKQLLMVSGFDRYFQIAPCFRDEAARADRSPGEFYQLDMEMAFATQDDVFAVIESVMQGVFEEFADSKPVTPAPFPRIPYREAVGKYGSDKPDLRNPIEMADVSEHFRGSNFGVFARILEQPKTAIWAIPAPGGGSRAFCDRMDAWAKGEGQPGMAYIFWREGEEGGAGPVARNLGPERTEAVRQQLGLTVGDAVFFAAGDPKAFYRFAGAARTKVGTDLELIDEAQFRFCWIVDFPMYEYNEEDKKIDFFHNPFSMPQGEMEAFKANDPLEITAWQYDIVCNGVELSSGAVRNHRPDIMIKAFELAGYSREEVETQFAGLLNAFRFGAPPHAGVAPGIDRIVMLLAGVSAIRDVIAFPLNQQAEDLMMGAPSKVRDAQLKELNIRLVAPPKG